MATGASAEPMKTMPQATFENVRRQQRLDGIALDTRAKIAFLEEMVELAVRFGARNRHLPMNETTDVSGSHGRSQ